MRAYVGNRAFRTTGTSVGFRVRSDNEVVEVKDFVRVRNAEGQVSGWLPADNFMLTARQGRRRLFTWLVYWRTGPASPLQISTFQSLHGARQTIDEIRRQGFVLVATKKITLEVPEQ